MYGQFVQNDVQECKLEIKSKYLCIYIWVLCKRLKFFLKGGGNANLGASLNFSNSHNLIYPEVIIA